jgi:DNA-binding response OmpR family regulator
MDGLIVLAEDEDDAGSLVKQKLEGAGLRVIWKKNGLEAWETIQAERPAMAILDADMPGLSGYDVLARIKSTPATQDTVVVMLTALGHEAYVGDAMRHGASDYIVKPFRPADLLERIQRLLNARAPRAAS